LEEWADLEIWTQKEGHFQHAAVGQNPVQTVSWLSVVEEGQGKKDGGPLLPQTRRELGAVIPNVAQLIGQQLQQVQA
jgi:hypothetical protein